jgi:acetyltransferase-like isoleucine patch superfamily enzyme
LGRVDAVNLSLPRFKNLGLGISVLYISSGKPFRSYRGSKVTFQGRLSSGDYETITARSGEIEFGSNFSPNQNVIYNADHGGKLTFGENYLVGPMSIFRTSNHKFDTLSMPINSQEHDFNDISVGNDVWIGSHVFVPPGVKIGNSVVIGAHSVVAKDIPDNAIAIGSPARVIRYREF